CRRRRRRRLKRRRRKRASSWARSAKRGLACKRMSFDRSVARKPSTPERRPVSPPIVERSRSSSAQPHASQLLQRRLGNRGTALFLARQSASVQASSLTVSSAHDPAEREAV